MAKVRFFCEKQPFRCDNFENCHTLYHIKDVSLQPKFNPKQNTL